MWVDSSAEVHSTAQVHPTAIVGAHTVIGPECRIAAYAVVGPFTQLGPHCQVHSFATVGGPAQDRRTQPDAPHTLVCGARNIFREGCTVSRGTAHGGGITRLGSGNLLMAQVHLGHDCQVGDDNTFANGVSVAGHVILGDQVTVGGHAAVHQFVRIGTLAFVAANSMVSRDVPPFCLAAGDRARLRGLNRVGLERAGVLTEDRSALKDAYRRLLRAAGPRVLTQDLTHNSTQVVQLARFLQTSTRGICPATRLDRGQHSHL